LEIRKAPTIINTTSATAREFPSSHAFHAANLAAERSGAATATTIGAATVTIEVRAKTMTATAESTRLTFALRISLAAARESP
jgi:hypothetical protein